MPENNDPAHNPKPEALPGEFDFAQPPVEIPRVRKHSLKNHPTPALQPVQGIPPAARELEREAPPLSSAEARPEYQPDPRHDDDAEKNDEIKITEPARPASSTSTAAAKPPGSTFTRPTPTTSKPTASPHGTRPATLYYSSGARKDKAETSPMKTTPSASPAPSTSTPSTTAARPTASTLRAASVVDYRTNVERQSREQKSVGDILSIIVYTLIGLFVVGASLSAYGANVVFKQLRQQSVTVSDLDARLSAQNSALADQLKTTMTTLSEAQAQIGREQELILKQQETINKLISATQDNSAALKSERATRAEETSSIRARLRDLEYRGPTTQKY
jgi:hypothetical protein